MSISVNQIVADVLKVDEDKVSEDLSPEGLEEWDSLNHLRLITAVEKVFKIHFSMRDIQSISNVSTLKDRVEKYRTKK